MSKHRGHRRSLWRGALKSPNLFGGGRRSTKRSFATLAAGATVTALLAGGMVASTAVNASAHTAPGNNGTLKVHEQGTPSGTESNDPKVCVANFEGFGLDAGQTGYLVIDVQGGDGPTGTTAGPYAFGPADASGYYATEYYNLQPGHYKATLYGKQLPSGQLTDEKAKSKVFKVECAPTPPPPVVAKPSASIGEVKCDKDTGCLPVSLTNAEDATADASAKVYVNGEVVKELHAAPGETDSQSLTLKNGTYQVVIKSGDEVLAQKTVNVDCNTPPPPSCQPGQTWTDSNNNGAVDDGECSPPDVCPNIAGIQSEVPSGRVKNDAGDCVLPPPPPVVCQPGQVKNDQGVCVTPPPPPVTCPSGQVMDQGHCVPVHCTCHRPPVHHHRHHKAHHRHHRCIKHHKVRHHHHGHPRHHKAHHVVKHHRHHPRHHQPRRHHQVCCCDV